MTVRWSLTDLRRHVRQSSPDFSAQVAIINSLGRYVDIFRFHNRSARSAMDGIISEGASDTDLLRLVLGTSDRQDDFYIAKIASEAHLVGCIHATRALWDVFAQLTNRLVLRGSIPTKDCTIRAIAKKLPPSDLKNAVADLLSDPWFAYVNAFVNTAKHRLLVDHGFTISFEEDRKGIRLGSFEYDGYLYPAYWADEVLDGVLSVKNRLIGCGVALTQYLGVRPSEAT